MEAKADWSLVSSELTVIAEPPDPGDIERNLYLDFLTRKVMKGWMEHETTPNSIPWTPLRRPVPECRVAMISSAGVALRTDPPFDQDGERRNPWWGDPSYRLIPLSTSTSDVRLYHLHIDTSFGEADLSCVLPLDRLRELVEAREVGSAALTHYSFMGYLLEPEEFLERSVPRMIERMRAESVDVALLVPV